MMRQLNDGLFRGGMEGRSGGGGRMERSEEGWKSWNGAWKDELNADKDGLGKRIW